MLAVFYFIFSKTKTWSEAAQVWNHQTHTRAPAQAAYTAPLIWVLVSVSFSEIRSHLSAQQALLKEDSSVHTHTHAHAHTHTHRLRYSHTKVHLRLMTLARSQVTCWFLHSCQSHADIGTLIYAAAPAAASRAGLRSLRTCTCQTQPDGMHPKHTHTLGCRSSCRMEAAALSVFRLLFLFYQPTLSQSQHSKQQQVQPRCAFINRACLLTRQETAFSGALWSANQQLHNRQATLNLHLRDFSTVFFCKFFGVLIRWCSAMFWLGDVHSGSDQVMFWEVFIRWCQRGWMAPENQCWEVKLKGGTGQ